MAAPGEFTSRNAALYLVAQVSPRLLRLARAACLAALAGSILGCGGLAGASGVSGPSLAVSISHQSNAQGAVFTIYINNAGNTAVSGPITLALLGTVVPSPAVVPSGGWSCNPPSGGAPTQFATCTNPGPIPAGSGGGNISVAYNITGVFFVGNPVNPPTSYGLSVSAHASAPGNISAGASDGVAIPLSPTTSLSGPSAALNFRLTHVGPSFPAGGTGSYVFSVQNTGDLESTGSVEVTANLPPGITYISSSGTGWVCGGGQVVSCAFAGPIAPGATAEVTLSVWVDASISGAATSNWSTGLSAGAAPSLLMSDWVLVEAPTSRR